MSWLCSPARAAGDPYLQWWTVETPHFRIHYYKGLEPVADKFAAIAEGVNDRLSDALGWQNSDVTDIVLNDNTDDANGYADAVPYNAIHLYVTAPDDLSPLGDYDDWQLELVTHEHTHVLHTDTIGGVPALVNAITGKRWSPNRAQPRWILEGLAVLEESEHTSGGRNRSSVFDMYLRADVLEHRLAGLDQMSHFVRRWPQGNLWYLYGSRFLRGSPTSTAMTLCARSSHDYGQQIIPWGINRSMRRATGRTYEELYEGWTAYLEQHYGEQMRQVEALGLREGVRLTHHGQTVASPRFVPRAAMKTKARRRAPLLPRRRPLAHRLLPIAARRHEDRPRIGRDSGRSHRLAGAWRRSPTTARSFSTRSPSPSESTGSTSSFFSVPGVESESGYEPERKRLTEGERAQEPDVSRDGTQVVFTENHRGTTTLMIARLTQKGELLDARALVPSARFEQAYTPRFSPDGKWVTYSAWTAGGYRDIRLVEVATGQFFQITHDRAMDWEPSFSPDGNLIFFASDRALGIPNIFAFDRSDAEALAGHQRANRRAFPGSVARREDARLRRLHLVRARPLRDGSRPGALHRSRALRRHSARHARVSACRRLRRIVAQRDHRTPPLQPASHAAPAIVGLQLRPRIVRHRPFAHHVGQRRRGASRDRCVVARRNRAQAIRKAASATRTDGSPSIFAMGALPRADADSHRRRPTALHSPNGGREQRHQLCAAHRVRRPQLLRSAIPSAVSTARCRWHPPPIPMRRSAPTRRAGKSARSTWVGRYSNAEAYLHSVGPERGFTLALSADVAAPLLASDYTLYVFSYSATDYFPMPWGHHHALALHGASAVTMGNYPYQGLFYAGGFLEAPLFQNYTLGAYQGPFVLRGYPAFSIAGNQYHLFNAEYRFPIVDVDRGFSTLPVFLGRISGNFFADYGGAFNELDPKHWTDQFHLGVGGELWVDLTVGLLPIRAVSLRVRARREGSPRGARRAELRRHLCAVLREPHDEQRQSELAHQIRADAWRSGCATNRPSG